MSLAHVAHYSPEKITQLEWRAVGDTLQRAQEMLEKDGCRHSWIDAAIQVCRERQKPRETTIGVTHLADAMTHMMEGEEVLALRSLKLAVADMRALTGQNPLTNR